MRLFLTSPAQAVTREPGLPKSHRCRRAPHALHASCLPEAHRAPCPWRGSPSSHLTGASEGVAVQAFLFLPRSDGQDIKALRVAPGPVPGGPGPVQERGPRRPVALDRGRGAHHLRRGASQNSIVRDSPGSIRNSCPFQSIPVLQTRGLKPLLQVPQPADPPPPTSPLHLPVVGSIASGRQRHPGHGRTTPLYILPGVTST